MNNPEINPIIISTNHLLAILTLLHVLMNMPIFLSFMTKILK